MTSGNLTNRIRCLVANQQLGERTDGDLLELFAKKEDEAAFAMLVQRHGAMVLQACFRIVPRVEDAEDAFQATFLILARKAAAGVWRESVAGWLLAAARNMAFKIRTQTARRQRHEVAMDDLQFAADATRPASTDASLVEEELCKLPDPYRAAIVLCHVEGKSRAEAARELGWKEGAVKIRLERGRALLRQRLARRGLAVPATLAGCGLESAARAAVSVRLATSTVQAAQCFAAGKEIAAGLVSARALALAHGGMQIMGIKYHLAVLTLGALLLAAGAGLVAGQAGPTPAPANKSERPLAVADDGGIPLPEGATMRYGNPRLREIQRLSFLAFTAQGKELITTGPGFKSAFHVWDLASGKQLRQFGNGGALHVAGPGGTSFIALSPDGRTLAVATNNGNIQFLDVATGKDGPKITTGKTIAKIAFAPDGKSVAAYCHDNCIYQWDIASGQEIRSYRVAAAGNGIAGWELAFTADGKKLVNFHRIYANVPAEIQVWSTETGKRLRSISDQRDKSFFGKPTIAVSADSKILAWAGTDKEDQGVLRLYDLDSGKELREIRKLGLAQTLAFSPDGATLAVQVDWQMASLFDVETGNRRAELGQKSVKVPDGPAKANVVRQWPVSYASVAFSPDAKVLAMKDTSNCVRLWDVAGRKEIQPGGAGPRGHVRALAIAPDGKTMTAIAEDMIVRQWNLATGQETHQGRLPASARTYELSSDGALVAYADLEENVMRIWDVAKGAEIKKAPLPQNGKRTLWSPLFSPDNKFLVANRHDGLVLLWDITGAEMRELNWARTALARISKFAFSADSSTLVGMVREMKAEDQGANKDTPVATVRFWDVATGRQTRRFPIDHYTWTIALSPDGRTLATGSNHPSLTVSLWEVASGKERSKIPVAGARLSFSPDGRTLAAISTFSTAEMVDMRTHKVVRTIESRGGIVCTGFTPNSAAVLTGTSDSTILRWDLASMRRDAGTQLLAFDPKTAENCWAEMAGGDAVAAHGALVTLSGAAPDQTTAWLSTRIKPVAHADARRIEQLIADLENSSFQVRERAAAELEKLRELPLPAMKKVLGGQPSLEHRRRIEALLAKLDTEGTPPVELLQALRGVEALELMGTAEAKQLLEKLAKGEPAAQLTQAAQGSLQRLSQRDK